MHESMCCRLVAYNIALAVLTKLSGTLSPTANEGRERVVFGVK
jgi:hypothetical protein